MEIQEFTGRRVVIALKDLGEDPGPYCMSFGFDLKPLVRSIKECGLVNTPFVTENRDGKMEVVVGYRRMMALKSLQWEKIPCRDLSDSGLSLLECLLLNLYDNLATRELNEVEKGMVLNRLVAHLPKKKIVDHYLPLLNLPSHEPTLDIFMNLEQLEHPIKLSLSEKRISFQSVKVLMELEADSRSVIFDWISKIRLNSNQQAKFIEYTMDLSIKEEKQIPELLREKSFLDIEEDKKLNNPQKAKLLLDLLKSRRFPLLTRSEKVFQEKISNLGLPEGIRVSHPLFFEGPDYRLEIVFKGGKELKEKINALSQLSGLKDICDPWQE